MLLHQGGLKNIKYYFIILYNSFRYSEFHVFPQSFTENAHTQVCVCVCGGTPNVMIIIVGNKLGDPSSHPR